MRNYLHRLAEIVAAALLVDDRLVDAAGGDVVGAGCLDVGEALVVAEVKIGLMAVHSHIAFTVRIGIERAGVDVDVRVKLLDGDAVAPALQQAGERRGDDSLAQGRHHAASHKNVFSFHAKK